jgi:hypothetical protein
MLRFNRRLLLLNDRRGAVPAERPAWFCYPGRSRREETPGATGTSIRARRRRIWWAASAVSAAKIAPYTEGGATLPPAAAVAGPSCCVGPRCGAESGFGRRPAVPVGESVRSDAALGRAGASVDGATEEEAIEAADVSHPEP